jgi:hypothetical protein
MEKYCKACAASDSLNEKVPTRSSETTYLYGLYSQGFETKSIPVQDTASATAHELDSTMLSLLGLI